MKTNALKQLSVFLLILLLPTFLNAKEKPKATAAIDSLSADSVSYDLIVFEPGYETFLIQQQPMNFYSESYYKNWNVFYATEWDLRYLENKLVGADQDQIFYNPLVDYGIELEYKLYYFFRFIEHKYGITLINRVGG